MTRVHFQIIVVTSHSLRTTDFVAKSILFSDHGPHSNAGSLIPAADRVLEKQPGHVNGPQGKITAQRLPS